MEHKFFITSWIYDLCSKGLTKLDFFEYNENFCTGSRIAKIITKHTDIEPCYEHPNDAIIVEIADDQFKIKCVIPRCLYDVDPSLFTVDTFIELDCVLVQIKLFSAVFFKILSAHKATKSFDCNTNATYINCDPIIKTKVLLYGSEEGFEHSAFLNSKLPEASSSAEPFNAGDEEIYRIKPQNNPATENDIFFKYELDELCLEEAVDNNNNNGNNERTPILSETEFEDDKHDCNMNKKRMRSKKSETDSKAKEPDSKRRKISKENTDYFEINVPEIMRTDLVEFEMNANCD